MHWIYSFNNTLVRCVIAMSANILMVLDKIDWSGWMVAKPIVIHSLLENPLIWQSWHEYVCGNISIGKYGEYNSSKHNYVCLEQNCVGESRENFMQVSLFLIYTFSVCMDALFSGTTGLNRIFFVLDSSFIDERL